MSKGGIPQLSGATLLALAACGSQPVGEGPAANDAGQEAPPATDTGNATLPLPPDETTGSLPPPDMSPRFVGRWASEAALCANRAWQFTPHSLRTPAGSQCSFAKVTPVAGGYDIAARCSAEAPPADEVIRVRFAESARAMMFESDAIADAGLIYCGPLGG